MLFAWYAQEMFKGSDIVRILLFLCVCEYLPDSGKLQGRKLSRIGEKHDFHRENFEDYSLLLRQRTPHPHILQEKLLRIATKPRYLRKFSPSEVSRCLVLIKVYMQSIVLDCMMMSILCTLVVK